MRWWLFVSEERRWLSEFDPTRDHIFDWPEDRKEIAKPVLDEMRAELMNAAYFGPEEHKLAICKRYIEILEQSHDKWYQPDLGQVFADLGGILGFTEDETQTLVDGLGYDVRAGRRIWPSTQTTREGVQPQVGVRDHPEEFLHP